MRKSYDLPASLPLFPLPGALLLPRAQLPLQIFEPRYLAMLEEVLKTPSRLIGMVQPIEVSEAKPRSLHDVGCAGRVITFTETDDGRYMITLHGVTRFRIEAERPGFMPYRQADVSWDAFHRDLGIEEKDESFDRPAFMDVLERYLNTHGLKTDWDSLKEANEELLINSLSQLCPFDIEEKQALLEAKNLQSRRETMVTLMQFSLHGGEEKMLQ
jgi:Lon protease-like protein